MKIHTTQNLNSLGRMQSTNNVSIPNDEIRLNYSEQMCINKLSNNADSYASSFAFRGKGNPIKDSKKIIKAVKKAVGDIPKEAQPQRMKGDDFKNGSFFNKLLDVANYETVVQAAMAAAICIVLRPLTILSIPTKKNKEDNIYASAHSISSGTVGLITTALLTTPFKAGANYTMRVLRKHLNTKTLERLYPHLDTNSIWKDAAKTIRKDDKEWLDKAGHKFSAEIKSVDMMSEFKQLGDVSEQTFKKILKVDADWASQKGKSFNDVVLKDGSKLYDKIDMSRLGIITEEKGVLPKDKTLKAQILLKDMDKEYLSKLINDAKGSKSNWGELDIASVYDKNNQVVDFRNWKDVNGKQWKLDLDSTFVSSPFETFDYRPRITGKKRLDSKENIYKFTTYQTNGIDGKLGTEIDNKMVEAEARNEAHIKLLTWLPDLAFRIPIAATTIALIPVILKMLHIEKSSKKQERLAKEQAEKAAQLNAETKNDKVESKENAVAFKGKGNKGGSWFARKFGELYGKPLIESENIAKISEKLNKLPGSVTQHMTTLGSLITSSVYVQQTLNKKDLDPDRRRTLAINQVLCFFIPTIAAYTVDNLIKGWTKQQEYRYVGLQKNKIERAMFEGTPEAKAAADQIIKDLGTKTKGVRILASLATFTLIYRYATPVIITPIANWISNKLNESKQAKAAEQQKAQEFVLNPNYEDKKISTAA